MYTYNQGHYFKLSLLLFLEQKIETVQFCLTKANPSAPVL